MPQWSSFRDIASSKLLFTLIYPSQGKCLLNPMSGKVSLYQNAGAHHSLSKILDLGFYIRDYL